VSVAWLAELLELHTKTVRRETPELLPCIMLSVAGEYLGLFVDALLDEQEVMLKPHSPILKRVRNVSGATILETGEVCIVLNPQDLLQTARKYATLMPSERATTEVEPKRVILLMEDSILTRTQEQRILESAGYEVVTAVDGVEALEKLKTRAFDAVVSDIQAPRMDGLTLTAKIRQDSHYQNLPIILVTALATEADKKKGLEAGANAYITKPAFDQQVLLETLRKLV